jgi:hypothetical protein
VNSQPPTSCNVAVADAAPPVLDNAPAAATTRSVPSSTPAADRVPTEHVAPARPWVGLAAIAALTLTGVALVGRRLRRRSSMPPVLGRRRVARVTERG